MSRYCRSISTETPSTSLRTPARLALGMILEHLIMFPKRLGSERRSRYGECVQLRRRLSRLQQIVEHAFASFQIALSDHFDESRPNT